MKKQRRTSEQVKAHELAAQVAALPLSLLQEFAQRLLSNHAAEAGYLVRELRGTIPGQVRGVSEIDVAKMHNPRPAHVVDFGPAFEAAARSREEATPQPQSP